MRFGLLFSDLSAVLIGLFGLYLTTIYGFYLLQAPPATGNHAIGMWAMALFFGAMTVIYLVPQVHQRVLRTTFRLPGRLLLIVLTLSWLFMGAAALSVAEDTGAFFPLRDVVGSYLFHIFGAVLLLFLLLIAPVGLAYADLRTAHHQRKRQKLIERQMARAAAAQASAAPQAAFRGGVAPRYPGLPNQMTWRSWIIGIPLFVAILGSMGAFRISSTTIAPAFAADLAPYFWHGVAATAAICLLTSLLSVWWEPNYRPPAFRNLFLGIVALPIGLAIMGFGLWFGVTKNFGPTAWNLLTENPQGTAIYRIDDISTTRKLRGCVTLEMESGVKVMNCGMDRDFVATLREGERMEVTGELSPYGHSFESVRVLP